MACGWACGRRIDLYELKLVTQAATVQPTVVPYATNSRIGLLNVWSESSIHWDNGLLKTISRLTKKYYYNLNMTKKYFFFNKEYITFFVCLILSSIVFISSSSPQLLYIQKNIFNFITWVSYPKQLFKDMLTLRSENLLLHKKLAEYKVNNAKFLNLKYENDEFKKILHFKDNVSFDIIPGRIVNNNLNTSSSIISLESWILTYTKMHVSLLLGSVSPITTFPDVNICMM